MRTIHHGVRRSVLSALAATLVLLAGLLAACSGTPEGSARQASTEEVVVPADGLDLVGTLRLPAGDGPAPLVVIVHGSGPLDRDGTLPGQLGLTLPTPVPAYREIAEALQARGYAVFTWDKRTCGPFNGCAENDYPPPTDDLTLDTLRGDVGAVIDTLIAREDIGEVVLIGHSKGGTIAAGVASARDDLAALVLLATPEGPLPELLQAQAEKFEEIVAASGQSADEAVAGLHQMADDVRAVAEGDLEGTPISGASRRFWASWIAAALAAPDQLEQVDVPVLALGGGHDWNVPPAQVRAWGQHLGGDDEVIIVDQITHALTRLGTEDVDEITADDVGEHVDPTVIDALVTWLDAALVS
ncbi:alpha/beta fold hydrolase [Nocardioides sp. AE5]|uniref:alpha/beta hydrolase n=1 Tax=Nocardioides sp. AE5 TaxID=2962573 RepID=UPI002882C496|nr:alpha/beta fold hydrolase [Nocardioides sp. AE5]MDT0203967.1 alpha/beta fold hydrolase [Nocardioides sp. AE5]